MEAQPHSRLDPRQCCQLRVTGCFTWGPALELDSPSSYFMLSIPFFRSSEVPVQSRLALAIGSEN
jgi:hypothetical protein